VLSFDRLKPQGARRKQRPDVRVGSIRSSLDGGALPNIAPKQLSRGCTEDHVGDDVSALATNVLKFGMASAGFR
jgi:hypothetical protein